jgi:uncharacterized membrane protein (DUF485 family)
MQHGLQTRATMEPTSSRTIARNARYGLILFVIYILFYAAFVYLSAFRLETMKQEIGGVTLAVLYGFGLIIAAFVLALVYMLLCRGRAEGDE